MPHLATNKTLANFRFRTVFRDLLRYVTRVTVCARFPPILVTLLLG